ncbi:hypothetical protein AcW1_009422 [Taiwanofungus camphoratus]|nr:hypothetical protein AcV5_003492 [Antrodia cinnamomea]KAI0934977.1 hypothetical protein AcV7_003900 [Antrodia cinnamomea]KAI0947739.1 hypothetical protein AcW1_009422 [Antrodia cinnamomea]
MIGKFLKVSYDDFMANFMPQWDDEPDFRNAFSGVRTFVNPRIEEDLYQPFVDCVTDSNMCPGFKFVLTPHKPDEGDSSRQKVDAGLYAEADAPTDGRPHWAKQRMWVEWKKERELQDPFSDSGPEFEATSEQRQKNRGQIISYAAKVFAHQHRKFLFTILILRDHARILFWDRSGAAVTEKFDYRLHPELLGRFLWRFSQLSPEEQGYDPTASIVAEGTEEYELMNRMATIQLEASDYVREYFKTSLDGEWTRWKLSIEEDVQEHLSQPSASNETVKRSRYFLVGKPHFFAPGVAGRGTRGYVAIDLETKRFVFLKDAWRVNLPGIDKEGKVVRILNEKKINYVPTLVCHGDIGDQSTVVQDLWTSIDLPIVSSSPPGILQPAVATTEAVSSPVHRRNPLKRHTHYRLVTAEVGRPLSDFRTGSELVRIMCDCLQAHGEAVEKAQILHRDISAGNLLILERVELSDDGLQQTIVYQGLLNDWELSKPLAISLEGDEDGQRQPDRTGTWQFTSAMLLENPWKAAEIQDELESFFHVLLYNGVRFLRHNCTDVGEFMHEFFDAAALQDGRYTCGERKWTAVRYGEVTSGRKCEKLVFKDDDDGDEHPLNNILKILLQWFRAYYAVLIADGRVKSPSFDVKFQVPEKQNREPVKGPKLRKFSLDWAGADNGHNADGGRNLDVHEQETLSWHRSTATCLQSGHLMYKEMASALSKEWPAKDKVDDQLPTDYSYEKTRFKGTSSKRDSCALEDSSLPSSKRQRPSLSSDPLAAKARNRRHESSSIAAISPSSALPSNPPRDVLDRSAGEGSTSRHEDEREERQFWM